MDRTFGFAHGIGAFNSRTTGNLSTHNSTRQLNKLTYTFVGMFDKSNRTVLKILKLFDQHKEIYSKIMDTKS
ncbi:hypothetical protein OF375_02825 [Ureaplasma miroungigenitalium]|uniref:hypothetical protein n=1 Tax=Ureaplasma miroungigenitalium TaxID=1042321 RepID=UPI0021E7E927|nr:hypothetical protein [Ureaplasma miroungigenitalium]MCV3734498.1 hypothetical protein [Ureaplasma miroungigenitalium]